MITAREILEKVEDHDLPVLNLIKSKQEGFTLIQVADHLKRGRTDVKYSIERLVIGKHIKCKAATRKYYDPNFDFLPECINKRPEEYAEKFRRLEEENAKLKAEKAKLLQLSERVVMPALCLAVTDYPLSSLAAMGKTDWDAYIESIRDYPFG
ncbi:hypothetical protein VP137E351_P0073 [Vibrio phage 137E35-1]|nr:hypothetical protein VP137E351_P0073 [Vibrio phage 137E35-1]CAH9016675.1 hypothetical protein VP230E391_P0071 [Vibrio phage 230E39-1]